MYRRPKFLEILDEIREEMSRQADYDVDLFAEMVRNNQAKSQHSKEIKEEVLTLRPKVFENSPKIKNRSPRTKK
jgi:hypothetical protein